MKLFDIVSISIAICAAALYLGLRARATLRKSAKTGCADSGGCSGCSGCG